MNIAPDNEHAKHHLILGGRKSGKTAYAEQLALSLATSPAYLATGQANDEEMANRIRAHQDSRHERFETYDVPLDLSQTLLALSPLHDVMLVDCLTLWITNLMMSEAEDVQNRCTELVATCPQLTSNVIFVSNEVGLGGVSDNAMARAFGDHVGQLHQDLAQICGTVTLVTAGLPLSLKTR